MPASSILQTKVQPVAEYRPPLEHGRPSQP